MMQKLLIISLTTTLFACQQPKAQPKEFTQEQLQQDIDQLVFELKIYHPGLYWYQNPEAFAQQVTQVEEAIEERQDFAEFYKSVKQLTSSIGCGHSRARMPASRSQQLLDSALVLPLQVFLLDGDVFTLNSSTGIPKGSKIVSVAGHKVKDIITELRLVVPSDGFNTTGKDNFIAPRFGLMLALYLDIEGTSTAMTTTVNYLPPGSQETQKQDVVFAPVSNLLPSDQGPLMSFTNAAQPMTKILRIRTFSSGALNSAGFDYFEFLEAGFSQLIKEQTKNLIIDVRGNGGGNDHYGATLVSYIANSSFGYFNSIEVTDAYDSYGDIEEIAGKRYMLSHQDLAEQQPKKNRYAGKVFILADGGSFSTTADFVSISKNIGAATIVGVETGGGACGNTSGNSKSITLKNTGIAMRIQMWGYSSAIRDDLPCGYGVLPDHKVVDLPLTEGDEVLDVVAALLAEG
jgi:hypothetical protein